MLTVVSLVAIPVFAALLAPENLAVDDSGDPILLTWDDVIGATKYSVDVEGEVTFSYVDESGALIVDATLDVELSFGTSDRTDGRPMGDSDLDITLAELEAALILAIQDALALPPENLVAVGDFDGEAKVKALNAGKGNGKQNNPFSAPDDLEVTF
jgi:hypothetical protein